MRADTQGRFAFNLTVATYAAVALCAAAISSDENESIVKASAALEIADTTIFGPARSVAEIDDGEAPRDARPAPEQQGRSG